MRWLSFMISGSNEQLQHQLEYTLQKPDCHSWWISKMQSGRAESLEERYAIKFCFKLGKNYAKETYGMLQTAFRPSCMNRASVLEWHKRFKEAQESVREDERCSRSKEVNTPELISQRRKTELFEIEKMDLVLNNLQRSICHKPKQEIVVECLKQSTSGNRTERIGNQRNIQDYPNCIIVEIGQNTEKSPGDLRTLAVSQTSVKDCQLRLGWKTHQERNNYKKKKAKRKLSTSTLLRIWRKKNCRTCKWRLYIF